MRKHLRLRYCRFLSELGAKCEGRVKDGTLGEVFDAIVRAEPRFLQWRTSANGAIHFIEDGPLPLLDITVHSFEVEDLRRRDLWSTLPQIPEVSGWLKEHGCIINQIYAGSMPQEWGKFAVHANDIILSAVLDDIAAKSGTYFWAVDRIQGSTGKCMITVVP